MPVWNQTWFWTGLIGSKFFLNMSKWKLQDLKKEKPSSKPHLKNLQKNFKVSKLELEVLLKKKKLTTLVHTTYISGSNNFLPAFCSHLWLHFVPCMHFASNRLKRKPCEMGILLPTNRHCRQTLLATFHADSSALPISFIVDAARCPSPPATSGSKLSRKLLGFKGPGRCFRLECTL